MKPNRSPSKPNRSPSKPNRSPRLTIRLPRERGPDDPVKVPLRFGDWLVRRRLIDRAQLFIALKRAYHHGFRIGDAMVRLGYLERDRIEQEAWSMQHFNAFCGQSSTWIDGGWVDA